MAFNSPLFFIYLVFFFAGTILFRKRALIMFYTLMSYLFYSAAYPPYVLLLFASTTVDYTVGRRLAVVSDPGWRKIYLLVSLSVNLGLLASFKYIGFFAEITNRFLSLSGFDWAFAIPSITLPIGISFYTFQTLSYTIDVYRGKCPPCKSYLDFACYVAFFPQLIAGPIVRASEFLPQINTDRPFTTKNTIKGMELVVIGYFKKLVVADNCAYLVNIVYASPSGHGGAALWMATLFFGVQIYADFSGYSDVARGLGKILGFDLPVNFKWPYLSQSMKEFWRRWHMTLSFWLRDYLYISLGGNRVGRARYSINIVITWFLGGLWHGAALHFIAWGLYHGMFVTCENLICKYLPSRFKIKTPSVIKIVVTYLIVQVGWVLFRSDSLSQSYYILKKIFFYDPQSYFTKIERFAGEPIYLFALLIVTHIFTYSMSYDVDKRSLLLKMPYPLRVVALGVAFTVIILFAGKEQQFIYFAF